MTPRFTVSSGLLDKKHRLAMGEAIWSFLLLLDLQTSESGEVLGGQPVRSRLIAERLGLHERSARAQLETLERAGYIRLQRAPYGQVITVEHPKKLFKRPEVNTRSEVETGSKRPVQTGRLVPPDRKQTPDVIKTGKGQVKREGQSLSGCPHTPRCISPPANQAYCHVLTVALAQGVTKPAGRWMSAADRLVRYSHDDLRAFVE